MEQIQEKEEEEEDFDFVPESDILNEAKNAKFGDEEAELIFEVLENLEKGDYGSEVINIKDFFNN